MGSNQHRRIRSYSVELPRVGDIGGVYGDELYITNIVFICNRANIFELSATICHEHGAIYLKEILNDSTTG